MSGASFIPVTKPNLTEKKPQFHSNPLETLEISDFDLSPLVLRRPQTCSGFVPDLQMSVFDVVIEGDRFTNGGSQARFHAAPK